MAVRTIDSTTGLGVALGTYIVLAGAATLAGMPWQYTGGPGIAAVRILGALLAVGVGVGLAWLALGYGR